MQKIADEASECHRVSQAESGWNNLVHTPLLDTVVGRGLRAASLSGFIRACRPLSSRNTFPRKPLETWWITSFMSTPQTIRGRKTRRGNTEKSSHLYGDVFLHLCLTTQIPRARTPAGQVRPIAPSIVAKRRGEGEVDTELQIAK